MNLFKKITGLFSDNENVEKPKTTPSVHVVGVAEPVITFVQFVKDNPKRFKHITTTDKRNLLHTRYVLMDTETNESWNMNVSKSMYDGVPSISSSTKWLKNEELKYIYEELIRKPSIETNNRLAKINVWKSNKKERSERERLMRAYGNKKRPPEPPPMRRGDGGSEPLKRTCHWDCSGCNSCGSTGHSSCLF